MERPGGSLRPSALRVARVAARALDLELSEPFAIASGAQDAVRNLLVEVELEGGVIGRGEAAPFTAVSGETQARSLATVERLAPLLLGSSVASFRMLAARLALEAPDEPAARSGLEQAVLDALARAARLPLWALHGGARDELRTDVTITAGDVAHARRAASSFAARGFRTLKIKVGAGEPGVDAERVDAAHRAAPGRRIVLDANGGYDEAQAIELCRQLDRRGVPIALFEQPIAAGDDQALARVRAGARVPICADESVQRAGDVVRLARAGAVDAVNVKIMKCGVAEAVTIIHAARACGLTIMIGGMVESEIAMLHSAHLASGIGGVTFVDLDTPLFLRTPAVAGGYPLDGDRIVLGDEPGLGVEPI